MPLDQPPRVRSYEVLLTGLTREGEAVGQVMAPLPDASAPATEADESTPQTLHVPAGIPGERVIVSVEEMPPRKGRRGRRRRPLPPRVTLLQVLERSPWRVEPPCPHFGACGGCQFQHIDYARQLEIKREMVAELLAREGGFANPPVLPTLACAVPWHYRNHMRFSVNREGQIGLTIRASHRLIPLNDCPIAHESINRVLKILAEMPQPRPQVLVRCGANTGQLLLQPAPAPEVRERLEAESFDVREEDMEEELAGARFRIRPSSFFQTNTAQAEQMAALVMRGLELGTDMTVADAYCGVGTFALLLAPFARRVIGIEESASAVRDALRNVREAANVQIIQGKTEFVLPTLAETIDGLVLDPPRQGCQRPVLDALAERRIPRLVYVSCDPATLARDFKYLCQTTAVYDLVSVQPLDMFPQTAHIECVAVLHAR
ncbi:MAG TPA: class I SAM-dependent RNA methyltransferase [Ktedonobacterales bacterium]|nr:class I SAM-dependent RNA methyltransferase [Ktedonobacterales bacterium]